MTRTVSRPVLALVAGGLAIELGLLALLMLGDLRAAVGPFIAIWTGLHGIMLVVFLGVRSLNGRRALLIMLGFAAAFRITAVCLPPSLSEDVYRYAWDGRLIVQGINPYAQPPDAPSLAPLRDEIIYPQLNSKSFTSVYPPLSQGLFASAALLGETLTGQPYATVVLLKGMMGAIDFVSVLVLVRLLTWFGRDRRFALFYAWNPLPILEFAGNAHSEAVMVCLLLLMLLTVQRKRPVEAAAALGGAALTKLYPIVLAPFLLRRIGWGYGGALAALLAAGFVPLLWGMHANDYLASLALYVRYFEFNGGIYYALKSAGAWLGLGDVSKTLGPALAVTYALLVLLTFMLWRPTASRALVRAAMILLGGYLLLSTTVHPWYVAPVLCLVPLLPMKAWLFLAMAVGWTYWSYRGDTVRQSSWLIGVEYGVFALLLLHDVRWRLIDALMRARGWWKYRKLRPYLVGERLLDAGSGDGWVAHHVARQSRMQVQLLDVTDFNRTALPMTVYDGRTMPFASDSFDTVLALTVLHHCAEPERVLAECARVCRRRLIVTESVYRTPRGRRVLEALDRLANRLRSGGAMDGTLSFRRTEQWRAAFERCGLTVVEMRWLSRGIHKHVMFVLEKRDGVGE